MLAVFQETEYGSSQSIWQSIYALCCTVWASCMLKHWSRVRSMLTHQWGIPDPTVHGGLPTDHAEERAEFNAAEVCAVWCGVVCVGVVCGVVCGVVWCGVVCGVVCSVVSCSICL